MGLLHEARDVFHRTFGTEARRRADLDSGPRNRFELALGDSERAAPQEIRHLYRLGQLERQRALFRGLVAEWHELLERQTEDGSDWWFPDEDRLPETVPERELEIIVTASKPARETLSSNQADISISPEVDPPVAITRVGPAGAHVALELAGASEKATPAMESASDPEEVAELARKKAARCDQIEEILRKINSYRGRPKGADRMPRRMNIKLLAKAWGYQDDDPIMRYKRCESNSPRIQERLKWSEEKNWKALEERERGQNAPSPPSRPAATG
jgi:hypothetical protein